MDRKLRRILVLPLALFSTALLIVALGACPKNGGATEECPPCGEGEICDESTGTCIPDPDDENGGNDNGEEELPCGSDFDDCEEGEVCDLESGECVPGVECDPNVENAATNSHCNYAPGSYQEEPGIGCGGTERDDCVCDPRDNICKKRRQMCEPCTHDEECGPHSHFSQPAECVSYDGGNVCLVIAAQQGCPSGYLPEDGYCVPSGGSCEDVFACTSDADCPEDRPICHRATGTCRAGCTYDFVTGESVGCPPDRVCHGDGRCRSECEDHDTCREIDESYICFDEPTGISRCRIEGCLHDVECPVPGDGPYLGFCDLNVNECYDDRCQRTDVDGNLHENPDRHCRDGYACREGGYCEQMACTERLAPSVACGYHQFCCGFCRNDPENPMPDRDECDPTPCPDTFETPPGSVEGCFHAEKDKWCVGCEDDGECTSIENPGDPRDLNRCFNDMCLLTCETPLDCPTFWSCQALLTGCETDDDCGGGECRPMDEEDEDSPLICYCESGDAGDDGLCPPDTRCIRTGGDYICGFGEYCFENLIEEEDSYCEQ